MLEVKQRRTESLQHYRTIKYQIKAALREAHEEARRRKEMEVDLKRQAELRARENAWKMRNEKY